MGPAAAARFARRTGAHNLVALIALREAEIETAGDAPAAARSALQGLRASLASLRDCEQTAERAQPTGDLRRRRDGMPRLPAGPSRRARSITYLAERIHLNPTLNSPNALRDLLRDWVDEPGDTN